LVALPTRGVEPMIASMARVMRKRCLTARLSRPPPEAVEDLRRLKANERTAVKEALETHLRYEPA
jgi:hypothetical protein